MFPGQTSASSSGRKSASLIMKLETQLQIKPGEKLNFRLRLINDTYEECKVNIAFRLIGGDEGVNADSTEPVIIKALGTKTVDIPALAPLKKGMYFFEAEIRYKGETVKSAREFEVK